MPIETVSTFTAAAEEPVHTPDSHAAVPPEQPPAFRCRHRYPNGTRCRVRPSQAGLCSRHFLETRVARNLATPAPSDFEDLSADLLPELSEFSSAVDIRQFLARLLVQLTKGRIGTRRASVLAFIGSQLLHSNRAVRKEADPQRQTDDGPQRIIIDMPRPDRD